jgi:hypothetical protein
VCFGARHRGSAVNPVPRRALGDPAHPRPDSGTEIGRPPRGLEGRHLALQPHEGKPVYLLASVGCTSRRAVNGRTVLTLALVDVRLAETGDWVADHLWIDRTPATRHLKVGQKVAIRGRVGRYLKPTGVAFGIHNISRACVISG